MSDLPKWVARRGVPEPPDDELTISGVTFKVSPVFDRSDWVALSVPPGREYWFSRDEIGALAAWLAEHAEVPS